MLALIEFLVRIFSLDGLGYVDAPRSSTMIMRRRTMQRNQNIGVELTNGLLRDWVGKPM